MQVVRQATEEEQNGDSQKYLTHCVYWNSYTFPQSVNLETLTLALSIPAGTTCCEKEREMRDDRVQISRRGGGAIILQSPIFFSGLQLFHPMPHYIITIGCTFYAHCIRKYSSNTVQSGSQLEPGRQLQTGISKKSQIYFRFPSASQILLLLAFLSSQCKYCCIIPCNTPIKSHRPIASLLFKSNRPIPTTYIHSYTYDIFSAVSPCLHTRELTQGLSQIRVLKYNTF